MQGIDIEQVKQYNDSLKQYQDKASQVRAGIDFSTKELNRLCNELTSELGMEVNPENIMRIRDERIAKIKNTLEAGNEILMRIKSEEEQANVPKTNVATAPVAPVAPVATNVVPTAPVAPVAPTAVPNTPVAPVAPTAVPNAPVVPQAPNTPTISPVAPQVEAPQVGTQAPTGIFETLGTNSIPPIFGI